MANKLIINTQYISLGSPDMILSAVDFGRLEQLVEVFIPLKDISDFLGGQKYVTGSCVVHAIQKLETILLPSQD